MLMKEFLAGFSGKPINKKQIAMGMHLCYKNAKALRNEAVLLKENGHYARALGLTILGLEELAKIPMLCETIRFREDDIQSWREFWKEFQSHKAKLGVWPAYGRLLRVFGKSYEVEFQLGIEPLADKFKQLSFYVSFFKDQFLYPEDDIAKDNCEWLNYFQKILDERIKSWERFHASLDNSTNFINEAEKFVATMKKAKTRDELKEMLSRWVSQRASNKNADTKFVQ